MEGAAGETSSAPSARLRERPYDVIVDVYLRDVRTCCCRDPCDLMTQHRRRRRDIVSGEQKVRMTQARVHVKSQQSHELRLLPARDRCFSMVCVA